MEAEFYDYEKNEKWRRIFQNLNSMSRGFPSKEARKIKNKELNRYMDVVPYDKSRVKLERYDLNYINASHVCVPSANRKYILTQGPLPKTCGHFWLMIWEQKTRAILMLNNLIECGNIKCHKYWPEADDDLICDDVKLKIHLKCIEKFNSYILRKFVLYDLESENSREILHFHYISWPDFDLPRSSDSFLEYLTAVRESNCLDIELFGSPVIHCSAGIGRSGTFVLVDSCLVMIEKNKSRDSINIMDVLQEIRTYRMGLIQTAEQLRFSFLAILEGSKKIVEKQMQNTINNDISNAIANKIQRSYGISENESDDNENEDDEEIEGNVNISNTTDNLRNENGNESSLETSPASSNPSSPNSTKQNIEEWKKEHDEKRQKTIDTINRIKRKQKEVEERLKFNEKIYKYCKIFCLVATICVGIVVIYRSRHSSSALMNDEL